MRDKESSCITYFGVCILMLIHAVISFGYGIMVAYGNGEAKIYNGLMTTSAPLYAALSIIPFPVALLSVTVLIVIGKKWWMKMYGVIGAGISILVYFILFVATLSVEKTMNYQWNGEKEVSQRIMFESYVCFFFFLFE